MSASGGFTPPEFPVGVSQDPEEPARRGLPVGAALGILAGVLAIGLVLVFTVGQNRSGGGTSLIAQPGGSASVGLPGSPSAQPSGGATGGGATPSGTSASGAGQATDQPTDTSGADGSGTTGGNSGDGEGSTPAFTIGECVDTTGSGNDFTVDEAACSGAQYKIIHAFQNESGNVNDDQAQCYAINGNDDEFENGDSADGYTLYCMNSLTGEYSPRRAAVDNCLDSTGTYEVDCTGSRAYWIVIGRLNGTTNTKNCSQFGSYDYSYYYTSAPTFVLCVNKYHH